MKNKYTAFLLTALAAATLVACGGGSSSSSSSSVILAGEVIDGYIEGATVCLDDNGDGVCGATEARSVTTADGKFSMSVRGNMDGKFLVVDIPATAKDSDDGGKTLAQAGKSSYVMATPASLPQVITPLTTLMVGKVKADGVSLSEARVRVLDELGLPAATDLHADHVKANDAQVHAMARQAAARLQESQKAAATSGADFLATLAGKLKDQDSTLGQLVSNSPTNLLNMPDSLAQVADGKLMLYRMISTRGQPIVASAMLFTPKAAAPSVGRPLVVLGVGTTGIAGKCGPSNIMQANAGLLYGDLIKQLIDSGTAVVVPDYEGRGPAQVPGLPDAHPYLHVGSAGNSMVLAAVASKRLLGNALSGAWAAWGHSQGGHAALAAAQFASLGERLEPALDYRGAVAVAPASHFVESVQGLIAKSDAEAKAQKFNDAYDTLGTLGFYASYIVQGSSFTASPIDPAMVLGAQVRAVHVNAATDCLNDYFGKIAKSTSDFAKSNGLPQNFGAVDVQQINTPQITAALRSLEPGRVKLPGKTLLVQGSADTTVLPVTTQLLEQLMKTKGSTVSLTLVTGDTATHSGVLLNSAAQQAMNAHLITLFSPPN